MNGSTALIRDQFANRFEPHGDGYVFRANLRAAGIPVSAADRDRFVAEFNRRLSIWAYGGTAGFVVLLTVALFAFFLLNPEGEIPEFVSFLLVAAFLPVFLVPFFWLWNAPARNLRNRLPVDQGRSKAEATQLAFAQLTWGRLGGALAMLAFGLWALSRSHNLLVGWNRLWLAGAAALLALIAVQAVRKWQAERKR